MKQISIRINLLNKATLFLIVVNIVVFLLTCFYSKQGFSSAFMSGLSFEDLIFFGAKENGLIASGHIYRLFLPMFIHLNIIHLAVNMLGLWSLGRILELYIGSFNLLKVYIFSGITGNLCSFAFLPNVSAGASTSLFGIFLFLFVLDHYEQKLARSANVKFKGLRLNNVLLLNIFLNILFGFTFPIFDWAGHLGGAIAGILLGLSQTTRHSAHIAQIFNLTILNSKSSLIPKLKQNFKYFYLPRVFSYGLLFINILFALSYFNVSPVEKIMGKSFFEAAQNKTPYLDLSELSEFENTLNSRSKETNVNVLLQRAILLHNKNDFYSSFRVYTAVDSLLKNFTRLKTDEKLNLQELTRIGMNYAKINSPPSKELIDFIGTVKNTEINPNICSSPADVFMALGFFDLSGLLYECAYFMDPVNEQNFIHGVESYKLAHKDDKVVGMISLIKAYGSYTTSNIKP